MTSSLKNISDFSPSIQPIISEFSIKFLERMDDNVLSILVYGSAAGANYHHGVSNINIAIILKNLDFSQLKLSIDLVRWGQKRKVAIPLFLTKAYVLNSLDVFPIEFSEIKEQHKLIFGEDIFNNLIIPDKDVRLLCEQQVKGKLLRLRQSYLDIGSNPGALKILLINVLKDLIPIFRQMIILKGQKPCQEKESMLTTLAEIYALDPQPFHAILHDNNQKNIIPLSSVESHLQNFLSQLEKLSLHLDSL